MPRPRLSDGASDMRDGVTVADLDRDGVAFTAWDDAEGRPPPEVPLPADVEV